jgi:hypothetical protein
VIRGIRQAIARLLDLDTLLAAAMTEGRRDGEREKPKMGPWVEQGSGLSLFDDRGQYVGGVAPVYKSTRYSWSAHRPFLPMLCEEADTKEEAQSKALAVLETWADVSAARMAVAPGGLTMSGPVSPAGEGGQES